MKQILTFLGLLVFNSSCFTITNTITNTPGFYSGYKMLEPADKAKVIFTNSNSLPFLSDTNMYAITASQLYSIIKNKSKVIIYFWSPHCSGAACIPIYTFKNYCVQNGYKGIIVAQYYDFEQLAAQGIKPSEIYAINQKFYKSDYCNKYVKLFQNDFLKLYNNVPIKKYPYPYLYIENNQLLFAGFKNMPTPPWRAKG